MSAAEDHVTLDTDTPPPPETLRVVFVKQRDLDAIDGIEEKFVLSVGLGMAVLSGMVIDAGDDDDARSFSPCIGCDDAMRGEVRDILEQLGVDL